MTRTFRWRLAWRVVRGGGVAGWARMGLMVAGVAAVVLAVLLAWSVPHAADRSAHREQARAPLTVDPSEPAPFSVTWLDDAVGFTPLRRVQIATRSADPTTSADRLGPVGCRRVPRPGTACASPALAALAGRDRDVAARIDGRIVDVIAPEGLTGPDELLVYEGQRADAIEGASPALGWGPAGPLRGARTSATVRVELAMLALAPAVLFLVVSARLSASSRRDRSRRLHLVGIDAGQLAKLAAVDGWTTGVVGGLVGWSIHRALLTRLADASWLGAQRWFPADGRPSTATAAVVIAITAWVVARTTAAGIARSLTRSDAAARRPTSLLRVLPVWGATLLLVGYLGLHQVSHRRAGAAELVLALSLIAALGTVAAVRPLVERVAARLAERTSGLCTRLGARRLVWDAASAVRVLTAPVALVLVAGAGTGVLRDAQLINGPGDDEQHASVIAPAGAPLETRRQIAALPALSRLGLVTTVPTADPSVPLATDPGHQALQLGVTVAFGSCAALDQAAPEGHGPCQAGRAYRLTDRGGRDFETSLPVGAALRLDPDDPRQVIEVPRAVLQVDGLVRTSFGPNVIFVADASARRAWPAATTFSFLLPNDEASVRAFQGRLAAIDPQAHADLPDLNLPARAAYRANRGAIVLGFALGGGLSLLALWIAALDRAFERRVNVAALAAIGLRRSEFRRSQLVQLAIPGVVGLSLAALVGSVIGWAYLAVGGLQHGWFVPIAVNTTATALAGALLALPAGLITFGYHLRPELLRRE